MADNLKTTPLHAVHLEEGARMVPFGGWEMPVEYQGLLKEHEAVRERAGLFDVSHMCQIAVQGLEAEAFLRYLLANDVIRLADGDMLYSVMCNEKGGVIDDLMVTRIAPESFLIVVNAGKAEDDWRWIREQARVFSGCEVFLRNDEFAMLALQGPKAEEILESLTQESAAALPFMHAEPMHLLGKGMIVSRSGYTGEDGFEILCRPDESTALWRAIREAGAEPAGLGARDVLRLEAGLCLSGQDIHETTTPLEANLGWTVQMKDDRDFLGASALQEQKARGLKRRLRGLLLQDRGVPRHGQKVYAAGREIGVLTSGTFSPSLKQGVALAYLEKDFEAPGTAVQIESRARRLAAKVVRPPFVATHYKK